MTEAGETSPSTTPLGSVYPPDIYSLSHVALPFPMSDSLYGLFPDNSEDFGINLGAMASRGERGALIISLIRCFAYRPTRFSILVQRIEADIPAKPAAGSPRP